jgi:hypothetical protein
VTLTRGGVICDRPVGEVAAAEGGRLMLWTILFVALLALGLPALAVLVVLLVLRARRPPR